MNVYLASRFGRRHEMRGYADQINDSGHTSVTGWLYAEEPDEEDGGMRALTHEERRGFAHNDLGDIIGCHAMIFFSEEDGVPGAARGGRHVEFGYALCLGKILLVVGKQENIFHHVVGVQHFSTFDEALSYMVENHPPIIKKEQA